MKPSCAAPAGCSTPHGVISFRPPGWSPPSASEYNLLHVFALHPNRVLSRDQLLDLSQGREADPFDRSIDVQVSRLRQRRGDDPRSPAFIKTVRGEGYVLSTTVEKAI